MNGVSSVGAGFGNFNPWARGGVSRTDNPYDKSTIINLYPKDIIAEKPTITPGKFIVPAAPDKDFSLLVIGNSSWWREISKDEPFLEISCPSAQIAKSIVEDHINSLLGANGHTKKPGIFFIPGEWDKKSIFTYVEKGTNKKFVELLNLAKEAQKLYFIELVLIADTMYARSNGNPLAVSNEARLAAEQLNVSKNKAWMQDFKSIDLTNCPACGQMVNPAYPICANCKAVINPEKAKGITFAQQGV